MRGGADQGFGAAQYFGLLRIHMRVPVAGTAGLTGLIWPTYVLDIPGGHGKVPIGPEYLDGDAVRDPRSEAHAL